jgi:hypothetical protein
MESRNSPTSAQAEICRTYERPFIDVSDNDALQLDSILIDYEQLGCRLMGLQTLFFALSAIISRFFCRRVSGFWALQPINFLWPSASLTCVGIGKLHNNRVGPTSARPAPVRRNRAQPVWGQQEGLLFIPPNVDCYRYLSSSPSSAEIW